MAGVLATQCCGVGLSGFVASRGHAWSQNEGIRGTILEVRPVSYPTFYQPVCQRLGCQSYPGQLPVCHLEATTLPTQRIENSNDAESTSTGGHWKRREWILAFLVTPGIANLSRASPVSAAEPAIIERIESRDAAAAAAATPSLQPSAAATPPELQDWSRVRGEGFVVWVPPRFRDITPEPEEDDAPMSTLKEGGAKSLFAARFASTDMEEIVSVLVRPTTSLKLSFFEVKDVADLGSLLEAAKLLVPPGAKLLATRSYTTTPGKVPRTYYLYEFVAQGKHVAMSAVVAKGKIYVLGAATSEINWKAAAGRMRLAAKTFSLVF